jgi:hypothetical protein
MDCYLVETYGVYPKGDLKIVKELQEAILEAVSRAEKDDDGYHYHLVTEFEDGTYKQDICFARSKIPPNKSSGYAEYNEYDSAYTEESGFGCYLYFV